MNRFRKGEFATGEPSKDALDVTEPHWTELPLSDTFERATREAGTEFAGDSEEYSIRPSRASRQSERSAGKGRARDDFERQR